MKDCQWIAELPQYGLLRPGFVPPKPIRELRDLTRQRTQLVGERDRAANRLQKVLEGIPTSSWLAWPPMCRVSRAGR